VDGRVFAEGDRVMTLKNTRFGVKNGTRGVVEGVDAERKEITIRTDHGRVVTLPTSYLEAGHLTHAYAMTGHKAQAMTTDKVLVLADETVYREWAYATMSRGRSENRLYVVAGADPDRDEVGGEVSVAADPMEELIRALGRSRAKDLALDAYEHEEIRNLTTPRLRHEWEKVRLIVDNMPENPAGESSQVWAERAQLEEMLRRQRGIERDARRDLEEMGAVARRRNRAKTRVLERKIAGAQADNVRLTSALKALESREDAATAAMRHREGWLIDKAPAIRRLDALGRELWWREQQQAIAAEVAMPQYLVNAVGEKADAAYGAGGVARSGAGDRGLSPAVGGEGMPVARLERPPSMPRKERSATR
jgi:hypothetical protein